MAFKFKKVSAEKIDAKKKYFFDANVWMLRLKEPFNLKPHEQAYLDFIDTILSDDKLKVYTHSLVISEVVNAYLRVSFDDYKKNLPFDPKNTLSTQQIASLNFKSHYRNTAHYDFALKTFKTDFKAYETFLHFLDNEYKVDAPYLIRNIPPNSDFNDYFYYEMAIDFALTIVTHDSDFIYHDVEILTENLKLLKL